MSQQDNTPLLPGTILSNKLTAEIQRVILTFRQQHREEILALPSEESNGDAITIHGVGSSLAAVFASIALRDMRSEEDMLALVKLFWDIFPKECARQYNQREQGETTDGK